MTKICNKCRLEKDFSMFGKGNDKYRLSHICLECDKIRGKEYRSKNPEKVRSACYSWKRNNWAKTKYYWIKSRCVRKNNIFNITIEDFVKWYDNESKNCTYCGIENDISIDRIIPSKGYVLGNLAIACSKCNLIKSDILSFEEMKEIAEKYIKPKIKNNICHSL